MKVYANHDETGTIHSLTIVDGPEGTNMMLTTRPGVLTTEVEGLKLKYDELDVEALRETASNHKISTSAARGKLTKKR